jgi:hypothetical protein
MLIFRKCQLKIPEYPVRWITQNPNTKAVRADPVTLVPTMCCGSHTATLLSCLGRASRSGSERTEAFTSDSGGNSASCLPYFFSFWIPFQLLCHWTLTPITSAENSPCPQCPLLPAVPQRGF